MTGITIDDAATTFAVGRAGVYDGLYFNGWIESQTVLTSLPDISEDIKARTVLVHLLEGTYIIAHNTPVRFDSLYEDMRAATAASTSSAFYDAAITEMEKNTLVGDNPPQSVAHAEYRIIDTTYTLESAQHFVSRGEGFKMFAKTTLHPKEYQNWTNTIEGFDKRGAEGIPPSLYAQAETAINNLRAMKAQFKPAVS